MMWSTLSISAAALWRKTTTTYLFSPRSLSHLSKDPTDGTWPLTRIIAAVLTAVQVVAVVVSEVVVVMEVVLREVVVAAVGLVVKVLHSLLPRLRPIACYMGFPLANYRTMYAYTGLQGLTTSTVKAWKTT
eukprot:Rmarinus@m.25959